MASISDAADFAEALEQDPYDGAHQECWSALGRVVDEDPTCVFSEGDANGMNVTCMVLTGPFVGAEVTAMVSCPLGGGFETRPIKAGMRVLLHFLEGRVDGMAVAVATVPGGREHPLPRAMAGVAVDEGALQDEQLIAPPKGANIRFYVRGGAFLVRLKGKTINVDPAKAFVGEFYVEGDDGDERGFNNTFIRLAGNPDTGKLSIKLKTADGAEVALDDGTVSLTSPNGQSSVQVSDDDIRILGKTLYVGVDTFVVNGTTLFNVPPGMAPIPPMAAIHGPTGIAGVPSTSVFIGR